VTSTFVCRAEVPVTERSFPDGTRLCNRFFAGQRSYVADDSPMGYLVTFPPHYHGRAHLHAQDQFQVFYPSVGAMYKKTPIDSFLLHYVDAFTVYGPFFSGEQSLEYFTLRARYNDLTAYMPEGRDQAVHRKTRQFTVSLPTSWNAPEVGAVSVGELIASEGDGLAAFLVEAGPNTTITLPDSPGDSPRYTLVLDGTVEGASQPGQALRYEAKRTKGDRIAAGPDGTRIVTMHYPDPPTPLRVAG
jgi:hypothetical protein